MPCPHPSSVAWALSHHRLHEVAVSVAVPHDAHAQPKVRLPNGMSAPQNAAASLGHPAQLAPDDVSGAAPTHFDALIIGTGLRESILAA
jgi:hypothetical protein